MSFERTSSGLSNAHLFHSVDFVVYVEGKYEEDNRDSISHDQYFWRSVAENVRPDKKFKFISRGSKVNLLSIAADIISGDISNTLVALDRDYDFETNSILSHPRIIYTFGYSWENDVWGFSSIMHLVDELYIGDVIPSENIEEMKSCTSDFYRKARRVARINIAAKQNGLEYVITSSQMRGLVELNGRQLPRFNLCCFSAVVEKSNLARPIKMLFKVELTENHIQGHLLAHFGYHFVCRALALLGYKGTICINYLSTMAINCLKHKFQISQDARKAYYDYCFSKAVE